MKVSTRLNVLVTGVCVTLPLWLMHHDMAHCKPFKLNGALFTETTSAGLIVSALTVILFLGRHFRDRWFLPWIGAVTAVAVYGLGELLLIAGWHRIHGPGSRDFGTSAMLQQFKINVLEASTLGAGLAFGASLLLLGLTAWERRRAGDSGSG